MAIKISELPLGSALSGTEEIPIVQSATTKKITAQDIADLASGGAVWGGITGDITDQTDLVTALNLKVDAVPGKGLSANDFTNTLKTKLNGIQEGAEVNVNADWNATSGDAQILNKPTIPATIGDMTKAVYDPNDTGIVLTASKEMVAVINKTGATITKGSIVYLKSSSSSGTHPEILLADADTEATSSKTLGATYEDILNDAVGYVVTSGEVDNLNTTAYNIGDKLWLSQTAGQVTTTPPTQPAHTVFIGTVTRSQNTNGRVLYAIQNGYELGELHNVLLTSPANNNALVYESSTTIWKNKALTTAEVADSTNKRYVTDANLTVIGNTSGTNTGDQTFLNPRVQTVTSSATVTAVSTNDIVTITAQAVGLTLANPTGIFSEGQSLIFRIKDNGTARSIAYGTNFRAIGVTAPTTTTANKTTYIGCIYNSTDTKFDIVGVCTEA